MGETEQVLSRFYGVLVDEIRAQRPDDLKTQFTVAEIYQNLVPYGSHREELESSNPNTGLYREYAAVDVHLNFDRLGGQEVASQEVPVDDPSSDEPEGDVDAGLVSAAGDESAEEASESESDGEPLTACRWCRADLPQRGTLNFCPFCGMDVHVVPCLGCGEELAPEWRFCAACGAEVQA